MMQAVLMGIGKWIDNFLFNRMPFFIIVEELEPLDLLLQMLKTGNSRRRNSKSETSGRPLDYMFQTLDVSFQSIFY